MKRLLLIQLLLCSMLFISGAQNVTILPTGIRPAQEKAYPRLTYDAILALPSPQIDDIAYDLTFLCLRIYAGNKWACSYQNDEYLKANAAIVASGGSVNNDDAFGVAVDANGNAYVTG